MADKKRAEVGNAARQEPRDLDPLADLARIIGYGGREHLETVTVDFEPSKGAIQSNVPAFADLEDELLREFALYDAAETPSVKADARFEQEAEQPILAMDTVTPDHSFSPAAPSAMELKHEIGAIDAGGPADESDDGTMPAFDFDALFAEAVGAKPEAAVAPVIAPVVAAAQEPSGFTFSGPVPDLDDFAMPALDAPAHEEPTAKEAFSDMAFSGPVPDIDLDDAPSFSGPVPDFDFDFGDDATEAAIAPEPEDGDDLLAGELELSLGALDLKPADLGVPQTAFAEWKNDRMARFSPAVEPLEPVWSPMPVLSTVVPPEPEPVTAPLKAAIPVAKADDSLPALDSQAPIPAVTIAEPEQDDATFAVDADSVVEVEIAPERAIEEVASLSALLPWEYEAAIVPEPTPEPSPVKAAALPTFLEPTFAEPLFAEPVFAEPVFAAAPQQPAAAARAETIPEPVQAGQELEEPDFGDFDFSFDEAEIAAEVSRAVLSEFSASAAKDAPAIAASAVAEVEQSEPELAFDPSQISEPDEAVHVMAELNVPALPAPEGASEVSTASHFEYDIEAEMAELFAMDKKASVDIPAAPMQAQSSGSDADNEVNRSIEEDILANMRAMANSAYLPPKLSVQTEANTRRSFLSQGNALRAGALTVIILLGGGAMAYLWLSGDAAKVVEGGEPRVIMADKTPIKEVPENPGGKQVPNQDKAVYDKVSGSVDSNLKQGKLITAEEEPLNVNEKTLGEETPVDGNALPAGVEVGNAPAGAPSDQRLAASPDNAANGQSSGSVLTPRKVKTMIVLPNGTLVAREDNAPDTAAPGNGAGVAPSDATTLAPAATNATTPATASAAANGNDAVAAAAAGATVPADAAATTAAEPPKEPAIIAPIPKARPADQPVKVVGTVTKQGNVVAQNTAPAATAPATSTAQAATPPAAAATASSLKAGTYVIQVASLPSQAEAQKSYANISKKFASVIGGHNVDIKAAEVAGKGTYYRVRIVAGTKEQAVALCESYRAAGGSCLVSK
jgi:hypothetical protein